MVFYFTGSGNSKYVAETISEDLNESCVFIPDILDGNNTFDLFEGERLGFVFPVYSWGIPEFMVDFIRKVNVTNVNYVYFVCTCGDDTGKTKEQFISLVKSRGWNVQLGYAIQMPNTYVCLPGFDVDAKDVELDKLNNADKRLSEVIGHIKNYDKDLFDTLPGTMPWIKSAVIRPLFNKVLVTSRYFHTNNTCKKCGKCVVECPMKNIILSPDNGHPIWQDKCVGCLRCYHICPTNSIQFGAFTKGKGQYCYKK